MKKIMITYLFCLFNFVFTQKLFSTDTVSTKYYPLQIGNSWTYMYDHYTPPNINTYYKVKYTITSTFFSNGHIYYTGAFVNNIRIDSVTGRLMQYNSSSCPWSPNEILIDSLSSRLHDSSRTYCDSIYTKCSDTAIVSIFGLSKSSKYLRWLNFEWDRQNQYA